MLAQGWDGVTGGSRNGLPTFGENCDADGSGERSYGKVFFGRPLLLCGRGTTRPPKFRAFCPATRYPKAAYAPLDQPHACVVLLRVQSIGRFAIKTQRYEPTRQRSRPFHLLYRRLRSTTGLPISRPWFCRARRSRRRHRRAPVVTSRFSSVASVLRFGRGGFGQKLLWASSRQAGLIRVGRRRWRWPHRAHSS